MRAPALALAALALSGCATRGPMVIAGCPGFEGLSEPLPTGMLTATIQRDAATAPGDGVIVAAAADAGAPSKDSALDRLILEGLDAAEVAALAPAMAAALAPAVAGAPSPACPGGPGADDAQPKPGLLLLSGGGQWGAFGAGYLNRLRECGRLPAFTFISGVSTGALQALFLAGANRPQAPELFKQLSANYRPDSEKRIVERGKPWTAAIRGSIAGSAPLRRRIEEALCPRPGGAPGGGDCDTSPMLGMLRAEGTPPTLLGFVAARTGEFRFVDVRELARLPGKIAQQCITGAALASAAVPVSYQQVVIDRRAYLDGGVRQSVFETAIAERVALAAATRAARLNLTAAQNRPPPMYVIRNGPTTTGEDLRIDGQADAFRAVARSTGIMVNALEVGSIAALRLSFPDSPVRLVTADGWDRPHGPEARACNKHVHDGREDRDRFFNPTFMACLQDFGRVKADRADPWIALPTVADVAADRAARAKAAAARPGETTTRSPP